MIRTLDSSRSVCLFFYMTSFRVSKRGILTNYSPQVWSITLADLLNCTSSRNFVLFVKGKLRCENLCDKIGHHLDTEIKEMLGERFYANEKTKLVDVSTWYLIETECHVLYQVFHVFLFSFDYSYVSHLSFLWRDGVIIVFCTFIEWWVIGPFLFL